MKISLPAVALFISVTGCSFVNRDPSSINNEGSRDGTGKIVAASFYGGPGSNLSSKTASGESFDDSAMTAAHRTLPFGTKVRLVNPKNEKSVVVRVNDRGPFVAGREIDISHGAAEQLGIINSGVAYLRMTVE
jgi:rare lipoprotein A